MPLGNNAFRLADDFLAKWLLEDFPFKLQIASIWPFREINGGSLRFASTAQMDPASFASVLSNCDALIERTDEPVDRPAYEFTLLGQMYRICYAAQDRFKVPNNIDTALAALAVRHLMYKYFQGLDTGFAGFPAFPGLSALCDPSMIVPMLGATATLEDYDCAFFRVRDNNGHLNAIMCNSDALRALLAAQYGRITPAYREIMLPNPLLGPEGKSLQWLPCYHGVPVYLNDCIPTRIMNIGNVTNMYFMVLGDHEEAGPGHGLTGIIPPMTGGSMFTRRDTPVMNGPESATQINVDFTFPVGVGVGCRTSFSVLQNMAVKGCPGENPPPAVAASRAAVAKGVGGKKVKA